MAKKKVGIKYCGGCNPFYERVEMIQRLQSLLEDRFTFAADDLQDSDVTVLVSGCPRACADKNSGCFETPSHSFPRENDFEGLIKWLTAFAQKDD
jgi:hypothetical protein